MASSSNQEEGKATRKQNLESVLLEKSQRRIWSSRFYAFSVNQIQILNSTNSKLARKVCPPKFASESLQMQTIFRGLNTLTCRVKQLYNS